jgi:hypothetical protein
MSAVDPVGDPSTSDQKGRSWSEGDLFHRKTAAPKDRRFLNCLPQWDFIQLAYAVRSRDPPIRAS